MGVIARLPDALRIDLAEEGEFEIGGMTVKPADRAVFLNGERVELQPRVMQVLVALAQARPDVVSRDRLVAQCWDGRVVGDDAINRCILALRGVARRVSPEPFTIETVPRVGHRLVERGAGAGQVAKATSKSKVRRLAIPSLAVAAIIGGLFAWSQRGQDPQTVLVAAASGDEASEALARDLSARLGGLELDHASSMRLVAGAEARADLIFRVAAADTGGAGVILKDAGGAILWSNEFPPPAVKNADLRQQIAFTTAEVLDCALEGREGPDRPGGQAFKIFLNACASLSQDYGSRQMAQALEGVVKASPRFVAGWARLLEAETNALASANRIGDPGGRARLRRQIDQARKVEPDLAEVYIAEALLMPPKAFLAKDRALSTAIERNPNHGEARLIRAGFYQSVGRSNDAVQDARQAVKLDPLSPRVRDGYVAALGSAGRIEAAFKALDEADRMWPGAPALVEARYRLHLRSGDAREALRILHSGAIDTGGTNSQELFLRARIDPSEENIDRVLRRDRNVFREYPQAIVFRSQALAEFGRNDELFDILVNWNRPDLVDWVTDVVFRPAFAAVHRDPRFMKAAERLGLLSYWRASGRWPDFCFAPDLTYDCKAEAARIAAGR
jgi:DNA-binding winged helix-turn-helix (wHTH) protein/tetratricopeptide (TPR) repeat protein